MPGLQSEDAFAILEDSFREKSLPKPVRSLPRRYPHTHAIRAAAPVRPPTIPDDDIISPASVHNPQLIVSPVLSNGQGPGLPPTPPSNLQDNQHNGSLHSQPLSNGAMSSLLAPKAASATPVNQRSPPTPDITPPASLTIPNNRPQLLHPPSSRAESFKTAREEQWSSDDEAAQHYSPRSPRRDRIDRSYLDDRRPAHMRDLGLGLGFERSRLAGSPRRVVSDSDSTPTERNPVPSADKKRVASLGYRRNIERKIDEESTDQEWDANLMRNVTLRRKRNTKPAPAPKQTSDDRPKSPESHLSKELNLRKREQPAPQGSRTPTMERFVRDMGLSPEMNGILRSQGRDTESKRLSEVSSASTVVEAIIVADVPPPQRKRTLRHVSKNVSLRSEATSITPIDQSPISRSQRSSLNSEDLPTHKLHHKRASIGDEKNEENTESPIRISSISSLPAASLKHQRQMSESRPTTAPDRGLGYFDVPKHKPARSLDMLSSTIPKPRSVSAETPSSAKRKSSQLSSVRSAQLRSSPRKSSVEWRPQPPRKDTPPALRPRDTNVEEDSSNMSISKPDPTMKEPSSELRPARSVSSSEPKTLLPNGMIHFQPASRPATEQDAINASRSLSDEPRRISFDRSTVRTEDYPRMSLDRSTVRTEEHAMARHLYAATTPFSQFSDITNVEVSEAAAVNIYPHNNNSLLVVQQPGRPGVQRRQTIGSLPSASPPPQLQPTLLISPSTPPLQLTDSSATVDSPLKNPRKPPEPPAFKIIPPTPAEELEESPIEAQEVSTRAAPVRRLSLVQRARRYSDSLIQPLWMITTGSVRRVGTNPRNQQRRIAPHVTEQRVTNLHPFWRPRGFWDDYDSEDDEEFWDEGLDAEPDGEYARLPEGGDTSDIPEPRSRGVRAVLDGFKGTGGFLIGNSLGVERAGTNVRRHHIALPKSIAVRRAAATSSSSSGIRDQLRTSDSYSSLRATAGREIMRTDSPRVENGRVSKKRKMPGLNMRIQYVGFRGVKDKIKEKRAEKRREQLRQSIGARFVVEDGPVF